VTFYADIHNDLFIDPAASIIKSFHQSNFHRMHCGKLTEQRSQSVTLVQRNINTCNAYNTYTYLFQKCNSHLSRFCLRKKFFTIPAST